MLKQLLTFIILIILSTFFVFDKVSADQLDNKNVTSSLMFSQNENTNRTSIKLIQPRDEFFGLKGNFIDFSDTYVFSNSFAYGIRFKMGDYDYPKNQIEEFSFKFYLASFYDLKDFNLRAVLTTDYQKYLKDYDFNKDIGLVDNQLFYNSQYAFVTSFPVCQTNTDFHECEVKIKANITLLKDRFEFKGDRLDFIVFFGRNYENLYYRDITISRDINYISSYDSNNSLNPNNDIDWANDNEVKKSFWDVISQIPVFFKKLLSSIGNFFVSVLDFIINLPQNLMNLLKTLFIPSDDFFSSRFETTYDLLNKKLGFLFYPIEVLSDFVNRISSISNKNEAVFKIPTVSLFGTVIFNEVSYDLMTIINQSDSFKNVYNIYRVAISGFVVLWLIQLAINKEREIMGGGVK